MQTVIIEYDYADKDYRSTFYGFYAERGREYRRDCIRLHFFDASVKFDPEWLDLSCECDELSDHYFGYMVVRPTLGATVGRSLLSPRMRRGATGQVIVSEHKVNLLGHNLAVRGFPSMEQPSDIAVCAHVSCWAILRHLSERYPRHPERLLYEVTRLASRFDPGSIVPSLGLSVWEAERVFQAAGCHPHVVFQPTSEGSESDELNASSYADFREAMHSYLESGFPLYVGFKNRPHAAALVGFGWKDRIAQPESDTVHTWQLVDTLTMVDDNSLPYSNVPANADNGQATHVEYTGEEIEEFIVVLPKNVHYPATAIHKLCPLLGNLLIRAFGLSAEDVQIRRYFMTTISELRRQARRHEESLGKELTEWYLRLKSPQHVWVVEFCNLGQWNRKVVAGRAIVDATASDQDHVPMLLLHDEVGAFLFDRSLNPERHSTVLLSRPAGLSLPRMELNLVEFVG